MKTIKFAAILFLTLGLVGNCYAWPYHHHGGPRVGFGVYINPLPLVFGSPYYGGGYYGNPYYAYPQQVIVSSPTVIYSTPAPPSYLAYSSVQPVQSYETYEVQPAQANQPSNTGHEWLYCNQPDGFYPAIKNCPGGWKKIIK